MRIFFAISLPDIALTVKAVQIHLAGNLRLTTPENLHITLHFVGEVSPRELEMWKEKAGKVKGEPFSVTVGGELMGFPRRENWRVLCAPVEDEGGALLRLHRKLSGIGPSTTFRPHVTIARCSQGSPIVPSLVLPPVKIVATGFHLMESQLRPSGPVYATLSHFPLK